MALPKVKLTVQYEDGPEFSYATETLFDGEPKDTEPFGIEEGIRLLSELCAKDVITYHHEQGDITGPVPENLIYYRDVYGLQIYDWKTKTWNVSTDFIDVPEGALDILWPDELSDPKIWDRP